MPISQKKEVLFKCPNCDGEPFQTTVWLILDAQEQPDQTALLYKGRLNSAVCPQCSQTIESRSPLLFHDKVKRCVIFAIPPQTEDYLWRQQAADLHATLIEQIPQEQRQAYLGEVQIAQSMPGIAQIFNKKVQIPQLKGDNKLISQEIGTSLPPQPRSQPREKPADSAELLKAIKSLLGANSPKEFQAIIGQYPRLLTNQGAVAFQQFIQFALEERDYQLAKSLEEAQKLLRNYQERASNASEEEVLPADLPVESLSPEAYQALIFAGDMEELYEATNTFPSLLTPWVDLLLTQKIDYLLEAKQERLAWKLEQRRQMLEELRKDLNNP